MEFALVAPTNLASGQASEFLICHEGLGPTILRNHFIFGIP